MPCFSRSWVGGVGRLTSGGISGEMDLPPGPIVEASSRAVDQSKRWLTSFLKFPPVKVLQFAL